MNRFLSIALIIAVLGAGAALIYTVASPRSGEKFTEFYILNENGRADDYPTQLDMGEEARLILGIINREQDIVAYRVDIRIDGVINGEVGPVLLEPDQKYEQLISLTPEKPGDGQKVEFLLYKQGQTEVSESLRLWINVEESRR